MNSKYLPIGSVCTLKGRKEKVMIIGLYSTLLDKDIKIYDYKGCAFPKGLTLSNQLFSFNQEDIEKIEYRGYDDDEHKELLSSLSDKLSKNEISSAQSNAGFPQFSNFVFDENGYVIKADSSSTSNPFINQMPIEDKKENNSIFRDIKFDENGTVIAVNNEKIENNTTDEKKSSDYKFDENGTVIQEPSEKAKEEVKTNTSNGFVFDENGTVIAIDNKETENIEPVLKEKATSNYEFDENGTVIAAPSEKANEEVKNNASNGFVFDENGVVISAQNEQSTISDSINDVSSSESNVPDIEYEFDENGVIIGVKSQKE